MKDVILQPHKTLRHCLEYVHEKAYETALEKAKKEGKTGVGQNAGIVIGSTEVFAWGIDYYSSTSSWRTAGEKSTGRKRYNKESLEKSGINQDSVSKIKRFRYEERCFGRGKGGSKASSAKERRTGAAFFI